jgi:hypothetical protein
LLFIFLEYIYFKIVLNDTYFYFLSGRHYQCIGKEQSIIYRNLEKCDTFYAKHKNPVLPSAVHENNALCIAYRAMALISILFFMLPSHFVSKSKKK